MFDIVNNIETETVVKKDLVKVINSKDDADERSRFDGYNLERILERLAANPTVIGYTLTRETDGAVIRTNIDTVSTGVENIQASLLTENLVRLVQSSRRAVKELSPVDELDYLRVNTRKYEIMVSRVDVYILIVVQRISNANNNTEKDC